MLGRKARKKEQALLSFLGQSFPYWCLQFLLNRKDKIFVSLHLNTKINIFLGSVNLQSEELCAM